MTHLTAKNALETYEKASNLGRIDEAKGKWQLKDLFTWKIIKK